ncbi:MAG: hypothetical protein GYA56_09935 [Geobacteraceae bacterium]|nr:hypothetical protein [Geobacteraceae bacterium]
MVWIALAAATSGCIVYPWYDGYYDPGYYGGAYGYAVPNVSFSYSTVHGRVGYHPHGPYHGHGSHPGASPHSGGHGFPPGR